MAERDTHCIVELSTGKGIETSETVQDVADHLSSADGPLASVTDADGKTHRVNIAHIVRLHERGARSVVMY
jgi:5,10-methylenetetrahydrofolate reductase